MFKVQLMQDGIVKRVINDPLAVDAQEALKYALEQNECEEMLSGADEIIPSRYVDWDEIRIIPTYTREQLANEWNRRASLRRAEEKLRNAAQENEDAS